MKPFEAEPWKGASEQEEGIPGEGQQLSLGWEWKRVTDTRKEQKDQAFRAQQGLSDPEEEAAFIFWLNNDWKAYSRKVQEPTEKHGVFSLHCQQGHEDETVVAGVRLDNL